MNIYTLCDTYYIMDNIVSYNVISITNINIYTHANISQWPPELRSTPVTMF